MTTQRIHRDSPVKPQTARSGSCRLTAPRRTRQGTARSGFSMAELMIAIVILGIGLLMAAVMFPVAWTRARELAEFTNQSTATNAAQTTVRLLTAVARPIPGAVAAPFQTVTSFLGDHDSEFNPTTNMPPSLADSFVHPLHLENAFADLGAVSGGMSLDIQGELFASTLNLNTGGTPDTSNTSEVDPVVANWLGAVPAIPPPLPQIAFHERFNPPLPPRPPATATPAQIAQWDQLFESRRFMWSVFHRIQPDATGAIPGPNQSKIMTFYFFMTRRTQPGQRFARQDDGFATTAPQAFDDVEDMLLPVPWLVNLKVIGNWDPASGLTPNPPAPTGVPSEAMANPNGTQLGELVAQMLQPGSILIDRLTGDVLTVKQHRFTGTGGNFDFQATVTLDREIVGQDYGVAPGANIAIDVAPPAPNLPPAFTSDLRDFWVFPPPVDRSVNNMPGFPIFDGEQPVVGVEVRQMVFTP